MSVPALKVLLHLVCLCSESAPAPCVLMLWKCSCTLCAYALKVCLQIACPRTFSESAPVPCVFKIEECSRPMCSCCEGPLLYVCSALRVLMYYVPALRVLVLSGFLLWGSFIFLFLLWGFFCTMCVPALRAILLEVCSCSEDAPALPPCVFLLWEGSISANMLLLCVCFYAGCVPYGLELSYTQFKIKKRKSTSYYSTLPSKLQSWTFCTIIHFKSLDIFNFVT